MVAQLVEHLPTDLFAIAIVGSNPGADSLCPYSRHLTPTWLEKSSLMSDHKMFSNCVLCTCGNMVEC